MRHIIYQVVEPVLYAADLFDIPEAVTLCCKFLLRSLTPYNALYTLRLGDMHNNQVHMRELDMIKLKHKYTHDYPA